MYIMSVVRVKGDKSLVINLTVGRLGYLKTVAVACKCAGCIAGFKLTSLGDNKLKDAIGHKNNRFSKGFVKLHFDICRVGKLKTNLVTGLILAIIALVNLVAKCAELNVTVCSDKL